MNKKILVLFFALLFSITIGIPTVHAKGNLAAKFYAEEGKKEFKVKDYDRAIINFQKALLADPDDEEALMYIKMLAPTGRQHKEREQDPLSSSSCPKTKLVTSQTSSKSKAVSPSQAKKQSNASRSPLNKASSGDMVEVISPEDEMLDDIDREITTEEACALEAVRAQAAKDQETILKKVNKGKTPLKTAKAVKAKPDAAKKSSTAVSAKISSGASESAIASKANNRESPEEYSSKTSSSSKESDEDSGEASTDISTRQYLDAMDQSSLETETASASIVAASQSTSTVKPEIKTKPVISQAVSSSKAATTKTSLDASASDREAAVVIPIKEEAAIKKTALRQKINEQAAQKIVKVHAQYVNKPIEENEKTIFRDMDRDGVPESIPISENKAIEKIQVQAQKEEQAGIKKIEKQSAQDQKAALKDLRALIKKEEKARAKQERGENLSKRIMSVKAGDVISDSGSSSSGGNDITIPDGYSSENVSENESSEDVAELSSKDAAALADIHSDLLQKEKDIQMKYAKKKAIRMSEAEKKARTQTEEPQPILSDFPDDTSMSEELQTVKESADTRIPKSNPKSIQAQNIVLKKKFSQVVEMSQKDQELIKELENNVAQKDQKVEVLEDDLRATRTSLDSKVEMIKEKEVKLKVLTEKIAVMEADMNSRQYNFKDKQLEYEKKLQAIQEEFGNYKAQRANTEDELREQLKILKLALEKKIAEVNAAQEKLIFTENKLKTSEEKYIQTAKQYDEIKKTMADLESRLGSLAVAVPDDTDQAPLVDIDPQHLPPPQSRNELVYQQWIKRQDALVSKLKDKILWAQGQMEFLGRYDIKLSDRKMAVLKEQLVAVKKQLSAVQSASASRSEEDFTLMEGRLKDSQERLEMVEKILHEKDDQVKDLEKQLNQVLSSF